jgi:hypothetical protein
MHGPAGAVSQGCARSLPMSSAAVIYVSSAMRNDSTAACISLPKSRSTAMSYPNDLPGSCLRVGTREVVECSRAQSLTSPQRSSRRVPAVRVGDLDSRGGSRRGHFSRGSPPLRCKHSAFPAERGSSRVAFKRTDTCTRVPPRRLSRARPGDCRLRQRRCRDHSPRRRC